MGRKKPKIRKSKKVFLFIVEGCTEENYINCLKRIYRKDAQINNCKGGSAKAVMNEAKKLVLKHQDEYSGYVIWFDRDTFFPAKDSNMKNSLESKNSVEIYISNPCVENWLLAHFRSIMPAAAICINCERELRNYIPGYHKNDCQMLYKHINKKKIEIATKNYPEIGAIPNLYFS